MLARLGSAGHGDIAEIVIVIAELAGLGGGCLGQGIEGGRIGKDRITPADEDLGLVTLRDSVLVVGNGGDLAEGKLGVGLDWAAAERARGSAKAAMAVIPSAPFMRPRREKRCSTTSPKVALPVGLMPRFSACSKAWERERWGS